MFVRCFAWRPTNESKATTDSAFSSLSLLLYESFARLTCPSRVAFKYWFFSLSVPLFFILHSEAHNTLSPALYCTDLFLHIASHETWRVFFFFRRELVRALSGFWIIHGPARHVGRTFQEKQERPWFNIIVQHLNADIWQYTHPSPALSSCLVSFITSQ